MRSFLMSSFTNSFPHLGFSQWIQICEKTRTLVILLPTHQKNCSNKSPKISTKKLNANNTHTTTFLFLFQHRLTLPITIIQPWWPKKTSHKHQWQIIIPNQMDQRFQKKKKNTKLNVKPCVANFVWEWVENGKVWFEYCPMEHMVADLLTKALSKERHHKLINMFGLETS